MLLGLGLRLEMPLLLLFSHTYTFAWAWAGLLRPTLTGLPPTLTLTFTGQGLNSIEALALRIHE